MNISSAFECGNIEVVSQADHDKIRLKIRRDIGAEFFQWFYFRVSEIQGKRSCFYIENASEASYPEAWDGYNVCISYDREHWFRIPTTYRDGMLVFEHTPMQSTVYFAYFEPYSYQRHMDFIAKAQLSPLCRLETLGSTLEGRLLDLLVLGEPGEGKKSIWIIGRQHAGEPQASWFMEGLVWRLLDESDAVARTLLQKADIFVVPMVNPDGVVKGNLRANAAGKDLNREWENPGKDVSPEVQFIRDKMDETGVDLNLDIHGDETFSYNFISSIEGIPSWDERLEKLDILLKNNWVMVNPDMQLDHGYPKNLPGKANLKICSKQIGERFHCLSWTVEMPFKDNANLPDADFGWTAERSMLLGESLVSALNVSIKAF
jgi:murein tripeptide amidase MpaA